MEFHIKLCFILFMASVCVCVCVRGYFIMSSGANVERALWSKADLAYTVSFHD